MFRLLVHMAHPNNEWLAVSLQVSQVYGWQKWRAYGNWPGFLRVKEPSGAEAVSP